MTGSRTARRRPAGLDPTLRTALAIHVGMRGLTLLAIVVGAALFPLGWGGLGADLGHALGKSDGVWYLGIAHHGYGPPPPIGPDGTYTHLTSLAFFPLYPLVVRVVALTGLPYLGAALLVTGLTGAAAAVAIAAWGRPVVGDRAALVLVAVWEVLPSSVVLSMAYSEALFTATAACCLVALQRRRWLLAGLSAGLAGLTRPTGGALVLAIAVAWLLAIRRGDSSAQGGPGRDRTGWRPAAALLLAVAGLAGSLAHVAVATGRVDGWFWLESTVWRSGFDGGWSALRRIGQIAGGGPAAHHLPEVVAAVVMAAAIAAIVSVWRSPIGRVDVPAAVYAVAAAVLALGERNYIYVKPRLLFVAFPLLAPLAAWLARLPRRRLIPLAVVVVTLSLAENAYLLVGWTRAL